jgi:oxygen-independent coproporphyrinogen-3 oxidase
MAKPHIREGVLEISEDVLKLTRKGIFVSDGIMSDLMWVD